MQRPVNDEVILRAIEARGRGYVPRLAVELDMDASHIREMLSGRRGPNLRVAAAMGYELRWVRKESEA